MHVAVEGGPRMCVCTCGVYTDRCLVRQGACMGDAWRDGWWWRMCREGIPRHGCVAMAMAGSPPPTAPPPPLLLLDYEGATGSMVQ